MELFDAHCHLQDERLLPRIDDVIGQARAAGVKLACGTNNSGPKDLGRLEYCVSMIRQP